MVARRYVFYFRVAKQYFTKRAQRVSKILFLPRDDINKIIEGNYQNYVIDKLTCEIMENKPLVSRM